MRWWGLAGGIAVSAADVIERGTFLTTSTFNGIVLVLIAGGVGGWVVQLGPHGVVNVPGEPFRFGFGRSRPLIRPAAGLAPVRIWLRDLLP